MVYQPLIVKCFFVFSMYISTCGSTVHTVQHVHKEAQSSYMLVKSEYHFSWSAVQHEMACSPINHTLACCSTSYTDDPAHSKYF